jgi:hypothetical protein
VTPSVASRRRMTNWLALAALALQLVVSFGHVHLDGIHGADPQAKAARFTGHAQPAPVQPPGDEGDDYCAICATIYLAANSFVPQLPALPAQFASSLIERTDRALTPLIVAAWRRPFQSRAPPHA